MSPHSQTEELCSLAVDAARQDQTEIGRERLIDCLLDHMACLVEGALTPQFVYPAWLAKWQDDGTAAISVDGTVAPAAIVAYINGQAANSLDFDDTLVGHPGAAIISAAAAVASSVGASVESLLRAIAAGYEVHWRLVRAGRPSDTRAEQVRGIAVWETIAAALAAGIVARLSEVELRRVVSLAAVHAVPPFVAKWYERPIPTVKNNLGWAALGGVMSAELASLGARGIPSALDGPTGFWQIAGSDRWDWAGASRAGRDAVGRVAFKRYPACWHLQQYLFAADSHRTELTAALRTGCELVCAGPRDLEKFIDPAPSGPADVAFSLPWCLALILSESPPGLSWLQASDSDNAKCERLSKAIRYVHSDTRWLGIRDRGVQVQSPD